MIEIVFKCSKCKSIYKEEVLDNNDTVNDYMPEGWCIIDKDTVDEKLICDDCWDWFEHAENW